MSNLNAKKRLKFSLEENEKGDLIVDICGAGMEIGQELFLKFFAEAGTTGACYAAGINAAMQLAYPNANIKKLKLTKTKEK